MVDRATFPSDTVSTHCVAGPGVVMLKRWGLFDSVLATNVTNPKSFGLRIGEMELGDAIPVADDAPGTTSPRRTVLDKLLVDAAQEEGAELREGITVKELITEDGRVVGIRGHDGDNRPIEERAAIVIGADGVHSFVAKTVGADEYDTRPSRGSGAYAYWSGTSLDLPNLAFSTGHFGFSFPTNDGLACLGAVKDDDSFSEVTGGGDESVLATLEKASPRLAEQMRGAKRETRYFAFRAQPGMFRKAYGDGWALVGDAGIYKDPVTGHGITDAFVQAEMLADVGCRAGRRRADRCRPRRIRETARRFHSRDLWDHAGNRVARVDRGVVTRDLHAVRRDSGEGNSRSLRFRLRAAWRRPLLPRPRRRLWDQRRSARTPVAATRQARRPRCTRGRHSPPICAV